MSAPFMPDPFATSPCRTRCGAHACVCACVVSGWACVCPSACEPSPPARRHDRAHAAGWAAHSGSTIPSEPTHACTRQLRTNTHTHTQSPRTNSTHCTHSHTLHAMPSARPAHAPVVQLPRLGQLALPPNGAVHAPQVGQRGRVRQPVQHLVGAFKEHGSTGEWCTGDGGVRQPVQHLVEAFKEHGSTGEWCTGDGGVRRPVQHLVGACTGAQVSGAQERLLACRRRESVSACASHFSTAAGWQHTWRPGKLRHSSCLVASQWMPVKFDVF